jgi:hypothetical protein
MEPIPAELEALANYNITVIKGLKLVVFFIAFPLYAGQISLRLASTSSFARVATCYLDLCDMEQLQVKIRHFSKTYAQQVIYKPFCEYGQGWWQGSKTSTALKVGA